MSYDPAALADITGENNYKNMPVGGMYYDTVTLGKDGKYYINFYSQPKDKRQDPQSLGGEFVGTIIKIRRKLIQWDNGTKVLESVEYDKESDTIQTTNGFMSEKEAKKLGAKVDIVLYVLTKQGIVKYTVPRNALFSDESPEDAYYGYIQSFDRDNGEHTYQFETIFGTKDSTYVNRNGEQVTSPRGTFKRGALHTSLDDVGAAIMSLPEILAENDARDLKWLGSTKKHASEVDQQFEGTSKPVYPSEEINPDDIPF